MRRYLWTTSSLSALLACAPASAQIAAPPQKAAPLAADSGDIIVTARRRAEKLEDVPATITAIGGDMLVKQGIHTEADLQASVPGLVIRTGNLNNQLNYVIRGESIDSYSGSVPGVQPYVNEVPISTNGSSAFYDIENVQVLKGPQGTLFGRNTTGGAVLYQTTRPKDDLGGYAAVQYGNLDKLITEGALNLPVVSDTVLLRVAGTYSSGGGFEHNLYDGSTLGAQKNYGGRASLLVKPASSFSNYTTVELMRSTGTNLNPQPYHVIPCGQQGGTLTCNFTPGNPAFQAFLNDPPGTHFNNYPGGFVYPGGLADYPGFIGQYSAYTGDWNAPSLHRAHSAFVQNTSTLELGSATIKNVFGYDKTYSGNLYDDDGTPYPFLQSGAFYDIPGGGPLETTKTKSITDELQLQGKALDNRLTYIVGFFYDHDRFEFNSPITGSGIAQTTPGDPSTSIVYSYAVRYHVITTTDTFAGFGQLTYALTDRLNVTAGVRGTWAKIGNVEGAGSVFGAASQSVHEHQPSWTGTIDYKVTPQLLAYVTTRGSWRVGGYSPAGVPAGDTITASGGGNYFLPEKVRDVEGGLKYSGRVGGVPTVFNIDVFNTWIQNVQKIAYFQINGNIASNTVNVPRSEITGVEADLQLHPAPWLRLGGNVSYNHARFTKNQVLLFGSLVSFGPYGDVPKVSGSVSADVTVPLQEAGELNLHGDVYAQSAFYFSSLGATLNPGTRIPGYALVNLRLDWNDPFGMKGFSISGFAKNLTNKLYFTGGNPGAQDISLEAVNLGTPRTYGVVARYAF